MATHKLFSSSASLKGGSGNFASSVPPASWASSAEACLRFPRGAGPLMLGLLIMCVCVLGGLGGGGVGMICEEWAAWIC